MSAAFKICRGITAREDLKVLMDGIERMQVVQINLQEHDDPQQIVTVSRQSACRSTGLKVRKGTILSFVPLMSRLGTAGSRPPLLPYGHP